MPTRKVQGANYIYERIAADGRLTSYRVRIRLKGVPTAEKSFRNLIDAKRHVTATLRACGKEIKATRPLDGQATVGDVIDDAIARIDNGRRVTKGFETERLRLSAFKRDFSALCSLGLAEASEDVFEDWIAERLETVKPNTVLRDFTLLKPIFAVAARKAGLRHSPLEYIKPPRSIDERVRRIHPDEETLLFAELNRSQDPIVPLAARFSLETGCRRSECLRVEWRDFDPKRGTIWLSDAKNGRGRFLLLTIAAQNIVEALPHSTPTGKIFPVTGNLLKKAFEYARGRAAKRAEQLGRSDLCDLAKLRWHDFRHEAISRCFDAGWTSEQVMDFSGHVDIKSLLRYRHPKVDDGVARLRALESRSTMSRQ